MTVKTRIVLCAALLGASSFPLPPEKAVYDFHESHDGRVVARVTAVVSSDRLRVTIEAVGPGVEPPRGFAGSGGENLQTARHLADGSLRGRTSGAREERLRIAERRPFRLRTYDPGTRTLVEGETLEELVAGVEYEARIEPGRPFVTELLVRDRPRLRILGRPLRFEAVAERPVSIAAGGAQDPDLAKLIEALGNEDVQIRDAALAALTARGLSALKELERFRDDADPERGARVRAAIKSIHEADAVGRLADPDPVKRRAAFADLEKSVGPEIFVHIQEGRDPKMAPAMMDVLVYEVDHARRSAAQKALEAIGAPAAFPGMLWAKDDMGGGGSYAVSDWLDENGDATVLGELDRQAKLGRAAAKACAVRIRERIPGVKPAEPKGWKPVDAAAIRRDLAKPPSPAHRVLAIRAVVTGLYDDPGSPEAVAEALGDRDEEVRFAAAEAMTHLMKVEARLLEPRLADAAETLRVRQMAAVALGRRKKPAPLEASFAGAPVDLRLTIASAIAEEGSQETERLLARLSAADPDERVRTHVTALVEQIRSQR